MDKHPFFGQNDVELIEEEIAYQQFNCLVRYHIRYKFYSGDWSPTVLRECLHRRAAVGIIAYDPKNDCVVLTEQFRIGPHAKNHFPWILDIAAGMIENDDDPIATAHRELLEETGCIATEMIQALHYWPTPGSSTEECFLFCARVDAAQANHFTGIKHEAEDIRVVILSVNHALEWLNSQKIISGFAAIALQWLALHHVELRHRWSA